MDKRFLGMEIKSRDGDKELKCHMDNSLKYGVLLINMGGPSNIEGIRPFLNNLFMDKDIIEFPFEFMRKPLSRIISKLRTKGLISRYELMGGGSPILATTLGQAEGVRRCLSLNLDVKAYVGMRYTSPFIEEALLGIKEDGIEELIVLPMYPHYSITSTGSAINELKRQLESQGLKIGVKIIRQWYNYPGYIESLVKLIEEGLMDLEGRVDSKEKVNLVFSAHGVPQSLVRRGDPYEKHIEGTILEVVKHFAANKYYICYQSKVGPLKWLEPSTEKTIQKISKGKDKAILVIPISFVTDNYETSYEIDVEYKELASVSGIEIFHRTRALGVDELFIKSLCELVMEEIELGDRGGGIGGDRG